jgi:hypothetical protein
MSTKTNNPSTPKPAAEMRVVVTGDIVMDWNLINAGKPKGEMKGFRTLDYMKMCWQRGGAALVADLIEHVIETLHEKKLGRFKLHQTDTPRAQILPGDKNFIQDFALWEPVKEKETLVWRVKESMGYNYSSQEAFKPQSWQEIVDDAVDAGLVIIDDADLGFRDHRELWPQALTAPGRKPWILCKCAVPIKSSSKDAKGNAVTDVAVWEQLLKDHADRMVLVISANELRRADVQISQELSWERTAQDLFWDLLYNLRINLLSRCAHVIITFGAAGAFLMSNAGGTQAGDPKASPHPGPGKMSPKCILFYDVNVIENMWEQGIQGGVIGISTVMTGAIARQVMINPQDPDIPKGIKTGLGAIRKLYQDGFGTPGDVGPESSVVFPHQRIAVEYENEKTVFSETLVRNPVRVGDEKVPWTILEDKYSKDLKDVAEAIVVYGPEKRLKDVPFGKFGNLTTVDRTEIEAFRSIRVLISEYCKQPQKRPLNIAVFGSPGSGKSFGVTEVAKSLFKEIEKIEFNLSQLRTVEELYAAMHQIRDIGLQGKIPLVFWDEFDSTFNGIAYGWLKCFLMPMQDGKFQEGEIFHPIGRAIFVFAGGTCFTFKDLEKMNEDYPNAKIPDFTSRLRGIVNILGPNKIGSPGAGGKDPDPYYVIRRAFVLRIIFEREKSTEKLFTTLQDKTKKLNIDSGVLRAFLMIPQYKHGIRSIESLIMMSQLSSKSKLERSCLPPESQLDLHVNAKGFMALVQQLELDDDLVEKLAEANHLLYCKKNNPIGPKLTVNDLKDDPSLKNAWEKTYSVLPENEKDQNRGAVRDIPRKLAMVNFTMIPATGNDQPSRLTKDEIETLARAEHLRWNKAKIAAGWAYAPNTDKKNTLHKCIVPWRLLEDEIKADYSAEERKALGDVELPEEEREKDRDSIRDIPNILFLAGYIIIRLGTEID